MLWHTKTQEKRKRRNETLRVEKSPECRPRVDCQELPAEETARVMVKKNFDGGVEVWIE
jgi:hypothetical protein